MTSTYIKIEQSPRLQGSAPLHGAKNATLTILASLILTEGISILHNVPHSDDVVYMVYLLQSLGAKTTFVDEHTLQVDTTTLNAYSIDPLIMKKMRASILVMGPLLARFGRAHVALPGGCVIGSRPINYHLESFTKMGVDVEFQGDFLYASTSKLNATTIIMDYPSVGATENVMMAAVRTAGITRIVNAALEPEVLDLIAILKKMGAHIVIHPAATIEIEGVSHLQPIEHHIMYDRLEAGSLMIATAITGGQLYLPEAPAYAMEMLIMKLEQMGHTIVVGSQGVGIRMQATSTPVAVSFKTGPYPGFPTDLQAPMMAAQCVASGVSRIEETVFENRLLHIHELQKMGASIKVEGNHVIIQGVDSLQGTQVVATDIRASCALVVAGLAAQGTTTISGVHHWTRGFDKLDQSLQMLGGKIAIIEDEHILATHVLQSNQKIY